MVRIGFNVPLRKFDFSIRKDEIGYATCNDLASALYFEWDKQDFVWRFPPSKLLHFVEMLRYNKLEFELLPDAIEARSWFCYTPRQTEIYRNQKFDKVVLKPGIGYRLCFQEEDINSLISRSRSFLFSEPGTGKTFETISWASHLYHQGKIDKIFIYAELNSLWHWRTEILRFSALFKEEDLILIDNDTKSYFKDAVNEKIYIIAHHINEELVLESSGNTRKREFTDRKIAKLNRDIPQALKAIKDKNKLHNWGLKYKNRYHKILDYVDEKIILEKAEIRDIDVTIKDFRYEKKLLQKKTNMNWEDIEINLIEKVGGKTAAFIGDEIHRFTNPLAVRTKALHCCIDHFKYRIAATATPATSKFEKMWSIARIVDPGILNHTYKSFQTFIASEIDPYGAVGVYDQDKKKIILDLMKPYTVKRKKKDDPNFTVNLYRKSVWLRYPDNYRKIYELIQEKELAVLKGKDKEIRWDSVMNKFPYLSQALDCPLLLKDRLSEMGFQGDYGLTALFNKLDFAKDPKVMWLDSVLEDAFDEQKKVLVFDWHPTTLKLLEERYGEKYNSFALHGQDGRKREERDDLINIFKDPESECLVMFANPLMFGFAQNFQIAWKTIFFSMPQSPMITIQALERTYRADSTHDSLALFPLYPDTYDEYRYDRLTAEIEENSELLYKKVKVEDLTKTWK